jgi:hypothetical protein
MSKFQKIAICRPHKEMDKGTWHLGIQKKLIDAGILWSGDADVRPYRTSVIFINYREDRPYYLSYSSGGKILGEFLEEGVAMEISLDHANSLLDDGMFCKFADEVFGR